MQVKSHFSINLNAYMAGLEIGKALSEINPEIIFLFTSIHYNGSAELTEAIYDTIDSENTIIIGNTGDGFYEKNRVENIGVSALAINANGKVRWNIAHKTDIAAQPYESTKQCIDELNSNQKLTGDELYFISSNFKTDGSEIIRALKDHTNGKVVGGLASDDYKIKSSFVYANKKVLTDSIAILLIDGDIAFDIKLAHNMNATGKYGVVTKSSDTFVNTIDNIPASDFIKQKLGKPMSIVDEGVIVFKVTNDGNNDSRVRAIFAPNSTSNTDAIKLGGGIKEGNRVQLCRASPDKIISDVTVIAKSVKDLPFTPIAAIIVSCAGRKRVLGDSISQEVSEIKNNCPTIKAIAGYPSLGEIGPVKNNKDYSSALFHNMTFILLLIGEKN